jgi:hypothetical protein
MITSKEWKTCDECGLTHAQSICARCGGRGAGGSGAKDDDSGGSSSLGYIIVGVVVLVGFGIAGQVSVVGSVMLIKGLVFALVGIGGAMMSRK